MNGHPSFPIRLLAAMLALLPALAAAPAFAQMRIQVIWDSLR